MTKPKLTKKEIAAVLKSIKHWKRDIRARFLKGDKASNNLSWESDGSSVKCGSNYCALCKLGGCEICPYYKHWGFECFVFIKGHWLKFTKNPSLETCDGMIESLWEILPKKYRKGAK